MKLTYSANVKSVLPVLFSAIRVSPPSEEVHGGKTVGVDVVEYVYNQVRFLLLHCSHSVITDVSTLPTQPTPIPSYLIAIASGNIIYKPFPPHSSQQLLISQGQKPRWTTGVWTEPELMQAAYWEFEADTARYVHEAETLVTPYEFGVYDLLVLPPSFPYGGMENACLTFVTPSEFLFFLFRRVAVWLGVRGELDMLIRFDLIRVLALLAGDRSLVDVVGHEISHSWFGNNVTTADSGHVSTPFALLVGYTVPNRSLTFSFVIAYLVLAQRRYAATLLPIYTIVSDVSSPLGWTTWLERVLQGVLHGPAERDFSYIIGRKALNEALKQYESTDPEVSKYQRLVIEYAFGEDPDDA